jgi:plasmid replication initiation protein
MTSLATTDIEIRQHNIITTARYDYTACQLDILFCLLSQLKKEDASDTKYIIYVRDIENMTGRQWNYQQLREATADMGSRMFEVKEGKKYSQLWMFQRATYTEGQGCLEIKLSEDIRPYLFELKSNFTSYQLHSALKLTSKYAKRIYQLASQWKDIGETCIYSLDTFKTMLGLKDPHGKKPEQYTKVSMLQKFVLDIAVRQINEHTDLAVSYYLIKEGRSFKSIRFYINTQKPQQLPIQFDKPIEESRYQSASQILDNLGIKDAKLIQQILSSEKLTDSLFKFNYDLKTGRTKADKNPAGLLLRVLGLR